MKQPYNTTIYNTALYMRLSRDDENYGDSVSIETQRTILQQYAKEQGLHVVGEYVDVYNLKMIPFDTLYTVQTPKITAFEGKNACRKPLFLFFGIMLPDCRVHQCTQQTRGGCICTQAK